MTNKTCLQSNINCFSDYYSHTNSDWLKNFTLPDEYSRYSTFHIISTKINNELVQILKSLNSINSSQLNSEQKLIVDLYTKLTDYSTRNNLAITPLNPLINLIDSINSISKLSKVLGALTVLDLNPLLCIQTCQDLKDRDIYLINITEPNCILPSKEYYSDSAYTDIRNKYLKFIDKCINNLGLKNITSESIFNFEKTIADAILSNVERRNVENVYNIVMYKYIQSLIGLDLDKIFEQLKILKPDLDKYLYKINSYNFSYFEVLTNLINKTDLEFIKSYLKYYVFIKLGKFLSEEIEEMIFDFFERTIAGTQKQKLVEIKTVEIMSEIVGELIEKEYLKQYYDPKISEYVIKMIEKIKYSSCALISSCGWMEQKTKLKAINKINCMDVLVGHTKVYKDYSPLYNNNTTNLITLILNWTVFYSKVHLDKLGKKSDPKEWHMNGYDVNAYYNPIMNQIVFPAGILQEPFFSLKNSFEQNLGGIGSVIAHEISHGFDDQGRKFNLKGQLDEWWTKSDTSNYELRVQPLIKQFDSIKILGFNVSGKLTLGENIADYTAVTICTHVLELNNATNSQFIQMFKSYANIWKQKIRKEELIKRLKTDPHAPGRYRTNQILSNIPKFIEIYSLDSSHPMFIPDNQRVKLWK